MTANAIENDDIRVAAFARVSSEDQAAKGKASLPAQLDSTRQYAETALGGAVVAEFVEEGVSGSLEYRQRPEVSRLLSEAEAGNLDAVVWAYADRQGRSVVEVTLIEQELAKCGVEAYLVEGGRRVRDTADGILVEGVRDIVAEAERMRITQRMATGRYANAKVGLWIVGIPPTGYRTDDDKRLAIDKSEAEIIRYAFAAIVAGDNIEATTRKLNRRYPDYEGKRGGVGFSTSTVGRWLRNALYAGDGVEVNVKPSPNLPPETFNLPAPAVIDRQTWDDARRSLVRTVASSQAKRNTTQPTVKRDYALTRGRLVHVHGSGECADFFGFSRDGLRRYRCNHSTPRYRERWEGREGFDACDGFGQHPVKRSVKLSALRASEVEALVLLGVLDRAEDPGRIALDAEREARRVSAAKETETTLSSTLAEREALRVEETNLGRRLGRLSEEAAEVALNDLDERKRLNRRLMARLENEAEYLGRLHYSVEQLISQSVTLVGIKPGDSGDAPSEEDLYATALRQLRDEAVKVRDNKTRELSPWAVEWLGFMADRWDIVATITDLGDTYLLEAKYDASDTTPPHQRRSA